MTWEGSAGCLEAESTGEELYNFSRRLGSVLDR